MPVRTLVELLHIAAGVVATGVIASLAAWSVPDARNSIWWVAWIAAVVVIYMGLRPLRGAWEQDRATGSPDEDAAPDV